MISSPDKPEVVHFVSRVQVCVCVYACTQSCMYMRVYFNMHVGGWGEEEVPNVRTQNIGYCILSFWKVEEPKKDSLRH